MSKRTPSRADTVIITIEGAATAAVVDFVTEYPEAVHAISRGKKVIAVRWKADGRSHRLTIRDITCSTSDNKSNEQEEIPIGRQPRENGHTNVSTSTPDGQLSNRQQTMLLRMASGGEAAYMARHFTDLGDVAKDLQELESAGYLEKADPNGRQGRRLTKIGQQKVDELKKRRAGYS